MTSKKKGKQYDYFMTQQQIANVMGITQTDVKRIESRAIAKLRRSGKLDKFLGDKDGI